MHADTTPTAATNVSAQTYLPPTSLIICSRNRPKLLFECVQFILQGEDVPAEIIVIDQSDARHPSLATLQTDRCCEIRYLWIHSVGLSRGRNAGIAAAQYEILAFTDDDMLATPTWYGSLIRGLLDGGEKSIVTGKVLPTEPEVSGGFAPSTKADEKRAVYMGRMNEDVLYMGNAAMFHSAMIDVGFFDDRLGAGARFPSAEDNDLGFRLLESGYRIIYIPEALLYHRSWRGERDYMRLRWSYGRGQGAFYAKHLSLRDCYMLWRMVRTTKDHAFGLAYRLRHQRRLAYGDAIYIFGLLSGAAHWILTQRRTR